MYGSTRRGGRVYEHGGVRVTTSWVDWDVSEVENSEVNTTQMISQN